MSCTAAALSCLFAAAVASPASSGGADEQSVRIGIASAVLFPDFEGYEGCSFSAAPSICAELAVEAWGGLWLFADAIPFEYILAPEFEGEYRIDMMEASVRLTRISAGLQYRLQGMDIAPAARLSVSRSEGRFRHMDFDPGSHGDEELVYDLADEWGPSIALGADYENGGRYFSLLLQYTLLEQDVVDPDSGGVEGPLDNSFFEIRFCTGLRLF